MTINEMKRKVRMNSLIKTKRGWRYVCKITTDGVYATEREDDYVPFPPFYHWEDIKEVRN